MLGRKRAKSKGLKKDMGKHISDQNNKGTIKQINNKVYQIEGNNVFYILKGKGMIRINKGQFDLSGYTISQGEEVMFDYTNEDPLFISSLNKNQTDDNIVEIEITGSNEDIMLIDFNNKKNRAIVKGNYISIPNEINAIIEYNIILLSGKNNSGKSLYIPIIINKLLSLKHKCICLIDCDAMHPLSISHFSISLLLITQPILTNNLRYPNMSYKIISSIYLNNPNDINQFIQIFQYSLEIAQSKLKCDYIIINPPGQNNEMYSSIIYSLIQTDEYNQTSKAVLFIKNKNQNDKDRTLEETIVNQKNDFLTQILFGDVIKTKDRDFTDIHCFVIEHNCKIQDSKLDDKKKFETYCNIFSIYNEDNFQRMTLNISDIIFCFDDDCYSYINILSSYDILQMFANRHCIILLPDIKQLCLNKDNINCLCLSQIPVKQQNYYSIAKVISIETASSRVLVYTKEGLSIKNDQKMVLVIDNRIEKLMKKAKNEKCQKYISNMIFPYSIINKEIKNWVKTHYLGRNSYSLI